MERIEDNKKIWVQLETDILGHDRHFRVSCGISEPVELNSDNISNLKKLLNDLREFISQADNILKQGKDFNLGL